jgi:hypothetical protein
MPNPHKALRVKRQYFPFPGTVRQCFASVPGGQYQWRRRLRGDPACYRQQARPLAPRPRTSRTQHTCGLRRPRSGERGGCAGGQAPAGPDTRSFPAPWPFEDRRAHLRQGRGQLGSAHGRGGSSGDSSFSGAPRRGSGGPWDGASAPSPFTWDSFALIPLVPRPTPGARPGRAATACRSRARPASHQDVRMPGLRPRTPAADSLIP